MAGLQAAVRLAVLSGRHGLGRRLPSQLTQFVPCPVRQCSSRSTGDVPRQISVEAFGRNDKPVSLEQQLEKYGLCMSRITELRKLGGHEQKRKLWVLRSAEVRMRKALAEQLSVEKFSKLLGLAEHNPILAGVVTDAAVTRGIHDFAPSEISLLCRAVGTHISGEQQYDLVRIAAQFFAPVLSWACRSLKEFSYDDLANLLFGVTNMMRVEKGSKSLFRDNCHSILVGHCVREWQDQLKMYDFGQLVQCYYVLCQGFQLDRRALEAPLLLFVEEVNSRIKFAMLIIDTNVPVVSPRLLAVFLHASTVVRPSLRYVLAEADLEMMERLVHLSVFVLCMSTCLSQVRIFGNRISSSVDWGREKDWAVLFVFACLLSFRLPVCLSACL